MKYIQIDGTPRTAVVAQKLFRRPAKTLRIHNDHQFVKKFSVQILLPQGNFNHKYQV